MIAQHERTLTTEEINDLQERVLYEDNPLLIINKRLNKSFVVKGPQAGAKEAVF